MNGDDIPTCAMCDCNLTAEHILIECGNFPVVRERYGDAKNLQQLFMEISASYAFDVLSKIVLFYRI